MTDFAEVHAKSPDEVARWARELPEGYVPVALGDHADASPPQVHAIAVKLTNNPPKVLVSYGCEKTPENEIVKVPESFRAITQLWVDVPGQGFCLLNIFAENPVMLGEWVSPNSEFATKCVPQNRTAGCKPYHLRPFVRSNSGKTVSFWMGDHGHKNWRAEAGLTQSQTRGFTAESRAKKRYVSLVTAYRDDSANLRFGVIAWENPQDRDWEYLGEMTTAAYEAELVRRKKDGFRPVSVTSYGDPADPRYAASWVRYCYNPPGR